MAAWQVSHCHQLLLINWKSFNFPNPSKHSGYLAFKLSLLSENYCTSLDSEFLHLSICKIPIFETISLPKSCCPFSCIKQKVTSCNDLSVPQTVTCALKQPAKSSKLLHMHKISHGLHLDQMIFATTKWLGIYMYQVQASPFMAEVIVLVIILFWIRLWFIVPLENFSVIFRRHYYLWRAANFDLCSELMAIDQLGFFSVPHFL